MSSPSDHPLGDGVAVVTGAAAGIGEAIARHAASLGMRVVITDVAEERLAQLAADLTGDGAEVLPVVTDVGDADAVDRLAATIHERLGPVRLLVNNAGLETTGYTWDIPPERWERVMRVNVSGVFHGIRSFLPHMLAAKRRAYVVNLSSIGGLVGAPLMAPYTASKTAVLALSESLHQELQLLQSPVLVSVVLPAAVNTRIFADAVASPGPNDDIGEWYRRVMHANLEEHGISPAAAAEIILSQAVAGRLWILTHPQLAIDIAARRAAMLRDGVAPELQGPLATHRRA